MDQKSPPLSLLFPTLQAQPGMPDPFALSLKSGMMVCAAVATAVQLRLPDQFTERALSIAELVIDWMPPGATPSSTRLDVNGRDVTGEFAMRANGKFEGLVTGLANGPNVLTAQLPDGYGARLTIVNHPIGGPIFSGPQIQPWLCQAGATDKQCDQPPTFAYYYLPAGTSDTGAGASGIAADEPVPVLRPQ